MCREGETLKQSALNKKSLSNPSLKAQEFMQKRKQKDCTSQRRWLDDPQEEVSFRYKRTDQKILTHWDCIGIYKTCTSSNETKSQHQNKDMVTKSHPLSKMLFAIYILMKEKKFSPMDCHWVHQEHSTASPRARSK